MSEHRSDSFPIMSTDRGDFEIALRGYDRRQVDDYVIRSEDELGALAAERDSALGRSADLAAQLASSHAQIESMRRHLAEVSGEVTPENVQARVRPIVELAQAQARGIRELADAEANRLRQLAATDAAEIRRQAESEAQRMRAQAQTDLRTATEASRLRQSAAEEILATAQADATAHLEQARSAAEQLQAQTRHDVDTRTEQARVARERLDAEAAAARALADEDFEIALRTRRTEESRVDTERRTEAHAQAKRLVDDALAEADRLLAMARAEADRVTQEASGRVAQLTDLRDRVHADLGVVLARMGQVLADSVATVPTHVTTDRGGNARATATRTGSPG